MRLIGPPEELQSPLKVKGYYNSEDKKKKKELLKPDKVDILYIPFVIQMLSSTHGNKI